MSKIGLNLTSTNVVVTTESNNTVVIVTDENIVNVTNPITNVVEVATPGPQGPQGQPGPPGPLPDTSLFVGTASFNDFTSSYNTGSFTGSFTGDGSQLTGIVSSKWTGSNPITREGDVEITGSLTISGSSTFTNIGPAIFSGSVTFTQGGLTGSLFGTSSWANQAETASHAPAYLPLTGGTITGNVIVEGTASVHFLNVTYESASVIYSSGSNQLGDATNDIQTLIGSVNVSGSLQVTGSTEVETLNVKTSLTASGLIYPVGDNGEESFMQTDGNGNLSLQYVKTIYEEIVNGESTQLVKGTPVYVSGSQGAASIVYRANPLISSKMPAVYISADTLGAGEVGRGIALGLIKGVNTTGYPAGTEIYLAAGGGWTSIRPTGSAIVQVLGYVTKEGSGGQGVVLNPGPATLPNLTSGSIWIGNSDSVPVMVTTSSLSVLSSSYAATASLALGGVGSFSGSFSGSGADLSNIPASAITGLNLSQIATGSITASVNVNSTSFSVTSGSSTFLFVSSSGRVGLGITNPQAPLHIQTAGVTNFREQLIKLSVSDAGNDAFFISNGTIANNTFWPAFAGYGSSLTRSGLQFIAYIPSAADVAGSDRGLINFEALVTDNATDPGNGNFSSVQNRNLFTYSNFVGPFITIGPTGNFGLGTTSPTVRLDVAGSTRLVGNLTVTGSAIISSSNATQLQVGTNLLFVSSSGNIGIGNSSPLTKLDVAGSGRFSTVLGIGRIPTSSLDVAGTTRLSGSFNTATSGSILTVIGSGSAQPIFTVQGSQGELFSVTDSLSGSLYSINDISGLPILEVFSDNTILMGNYLDPMLTTTVYTTSLGIGSHTLYRLPTSSYDGFWFEYTVRSGSNARAGQIMGLWNGTSVNYTETTTTDFGSTSDISLMSTISGGNMIITGSTSTAGWTIKGIVRAI